MTSTIYTYITYNQTLINFKYFIDNYSSNLTAFCCLDYRQEANNNLHFFISK